MNIAFYAPFKPLDHGNPSGDLIIARSLFSFLSDRGHKVEVQSRLRARWIYFRPDLWFVAAADIIRILLRLKKKRPDIWLTYHTYYKAPDIIGPLVCRPLSLNYAVFQGIYSTKRRRRLKTVSGFYLNRAALIRADHVFTNKKADFKNLARIIPKEKLTYIRPGIRPRSFRKDPARGEALRKAWHLAEEVPVVLSAAMFRDDVKTLGLSWLIRCLSLVELPFHLVIAGSGKTGAELRSLALRHLPGRHTFAGKIARTDMAGFYSAGNLFAFPGIRESLGMVYLEAQSCGLPVVAFDNGGVPEVVKRDDTGILVPMYDEKGFAGAVTRLLSDPALCRRMGASAARYVAQEHDIEKNYKAFEALLAQVSP